MISDVLTDAIDDIRDYLDHSPLYTDADLRKRIVDLVEQMDAMRKQLDTPPDWFRSFAI
jgi:hypothetical protein